MISQEEFKKIVAAVKSIETRTRGEIVPVIVESSRPYPEGWFFLATTGVLSAALLSWSLGGWLNLGWVLSIESLIAELFIGGVAGLSLGFIPGLRRRLITRPTLEKSVHERALAEFTRQGVMNTQDRCGILLLVSLFEHRAELIADRGIHSVTPEGYWSEVLTKISRDIKKQGLTPALCDGIHQLGGMLAEKFPRQSDTINELSDEPRVDQ